MKAIFSTVLSILLSFHLIDGKSIEWPAIESNPSGKPIQSVNSPAKNAPEEHPFSNVDKSNKLDYGQALAVDEHIPAANKDGSLKKDESGLNIAKNKNSGNESIPYILNNGKNNQGSLNNGNNNKGNLNNGNNNHGNFNNGNNNNGNFNNGNNNHGNFNNGNGNKNNGNSNKGNSNKGGTNKGGSNKGGTNKGGSNKGGSNKGGSNKGNSGKKG